jgi:predicted DNA-binding transcriptional regulator AlpA
MTHKPTRSGPDRQTVGQEAARVIEPVVYRLNDLSRALGVSRRTIERLRSAGRFPRPDAHIGKAPVWQPETIRRWVAEGGGR